MKGANFWNPWVAEPNSPAKAFDLKIRSDFSNLSDVEAHVWLPILYVYIFFKIEGQSF
jgi:hypothetical protein